MKQKRRNRDTSPPKPLTLAIKSELERKNPLSRQDLEDVTHITPLSQASQELHSACKGNALGQDRNVRTFHAFWIFQVMPWSPS